LVEYLPEFAPQLGSPLPQSGGKKVPKKIGKMRGKIPCLLNKSLQIGRSPPLKKMDMVKNLKDEFQIGK